MKHRNRWVYAGIGVVVLLLIGLVYAWTVLQAPIAMSFPEWSKGQLSLTFTITMICFCIGGIVGGILQKKFKPRSLVWISAVLFLVGFSITAATNSLIMLYLGFGICAGFASGMAYNAVISSVSCWFPDKLGLVSGVLLMGFGMSSFIIGKVYTAVTPTDGGDAWRTTFSVLGIVLFAVLAASGFFVVKPDGSWSPPTTSNSKAAKEFFEEIGPGNMLRRSPFWLYMVWATFLTAGGLAIISQGTPMALEACPNLTMNTVATIVGLISIFNGVGRIAFGALFDKVGRFWTMLCGGVVYIVAMALLITAFTNHNATVLVASYILSGLAYGCVPPTNAAFANLFYGRKNSPANLSVVNVCVLIASFGSTAAGIVYDRSRSYTAIIAVVIALIVLGIIVSLFIRKPNGVREILPAKSIP